MSIDLKEYPEIYILSQLEEFKKLAQVKVPYVHQNPTDKEVREQKIIDNSTL